MRDPDPRHDQESGVVGKEMAILFSERWSPSDEMISRPQMPCRGAEDKARNRPIPGKNHVLDMLTDRSFRDSPSICHFFLHFQALNRPFA